MAQQDHPADPIPPSVGPITLVLATDVPHANDPPPPYPSRERRVRSLRTPRRRRAADIGHAQTPSGGTESDDEGNGARSPYPALADQEYDATETTPLLPPSSSPSRLPGGLGGRQRTLSITSTVRSSTSMAPSFAQTVVSAFHPERDSDLDPDCDASIEDGERGGAFDSHAHAGEASTNAEGRALVAEISNQRLARRGHSWGSIWRRYFRPMGKRAYYSALFHLLFLNFPYALIAWIYLFVFTLTGTITLMALPLGAVLCFLDLLGARAFARGELFLQSTFHGPLAFPPPYPPNPIFTRLRAPTPAQLEAGHRLTHERSFYRNAYAMFTDPTSYQALFYFLIIKPGITFLLSISLIILVPLSIVLVLPIPAMLRLIRRVGIWQANLAVEGLYFAVR